MRGRSRNLGQCLSAASEFLYVEIDLADLARNADVLWTLSNAYSAGNASVCLS